MNITKEGALIIGAAGWLVYNHVEFRDFVVADNYGELFGCWDLSSKRKIMPDDVETLLRGTPWEDIEVSYLDEDLITLTVKKEA
jgi:hypothetical protein